MKVNFKEAPAWAKTLRKYYKQLDELGGRNASFGSFIKKHCDKIHKILKQITTFRKKCDNANGGLKVRSVEEFSECVKL